RPRRIAPVLLRDLTIENYRSFDKYRLDNLARVNLLVGDNNCGKTSVLEAVRIFLVPDADSVIDVQLNRDDRSIGGIVPAGVDPNFPNVGVATLFYGDYSGLAELGYSRLRAYPKISIQGSIDVNTASTIKSSRIVELFFDVSPLLDMSSNGNRTILEFTHLVVQTTEDRSRKRTVFAPVAIPSSRITCRGPWNAQGFSARHNLYTIPQQGTDFRRFIEVWSKLVESEMKRYAIHSLKVIIPDLDDVEILPAAASRADVLIRRSQRRDTLASLGAGSSNVLAIGALLAASQAGCLIIDEIDTGLHYSRLPDMWRMVIQSAKDLDVQVFATTHSLDCIRGLAAAVRDDESFSDEVAIFRIDRRTDTAVRFDGDELQTVVNHEIEVR
ncbi:MAG: AAA family ATPase, partial [Planctomycetaceae bacterium]|nr:AAA family ATPase [Planctomycetaceae bacterium]